MLNLFIMRHGEAEFLANSDSERILTNKGVMQVSQQGNWLSQQHINLKHVGVSPYLRAEQTFSVVRDVFLQNQNIDLLNIYQKWEQLIPSGNEQNILLQISELITEQMLNESVEAGILLVSHLPLVDEICYSLCGQSFRFMPATIVQLGYANKQWTFIQQKHA